MTDEQTAMLAKKQAFRENILKAGNLDPTIWSIERIETIKKIAAPDAKNAHELAAFLGFCEKFGLDPINGCWLMDTGKGRMGIEVSRDGWISIANRNDDFRGMEYGVVRKGEEFEIVRSKGDCWVEHKSTAASAGAAIVSGYCILYREGHRPTVVHMPIGEMNTRGPVWRSQPGVMMITRVISFAVKTAYGITAYAQGELAGVAEDHDGPTTDDVDVAAATRAKLESLKAAAAPVADAEEVTEVVAPPEEAVEAEVVDEDPPGVETESHESADEPDWKAGRTALFEEFLEAGLTDLDVDAAWKQIHGEAPMDAKFKSARETWNEYNQPDQRAQLLDVARSLKTAPADDGGESDDLFGADHNSGR